MKAPESPRTLRDESFPGVGSSRACPPAQPAGFIRVPPHRQCDAEKTPGTQPRDIYTPGRTRKSVRGWTESRHMPRDDDGPHRST